MLITCILPPGAHYLDRLVGLYFCTEETYPKVLITLHYYLTVQCLLLYTDESYLKVLIIVHIILRQGAHYFTTDVS